MIQENEMPRLLPSKVISLGQHPFEQISVTDGSPREDDTRFGHGKLQSEIAHDGPHYRLLRQLPLAMNIERQHRHNMIAVHDSSLFADEDGAIGIPVQRHSEMSPVLADRLLQQCGMHRATAGI